MRKFFLFACILCMPLAMSGASLYTQDIQIASPTDILPNSPSMYLESVDSGVAGDFVSGLIAWLIGLTAVLAVLAITWSGIQMIIAIGEDEKFKKARYTMIYAFVGLILSGLAFATVSFVTNLDLNNFF